LLNKVKHPEPFGSTIVPKGHFTIAGGSGAKSFLKKTFYNPDVRHVIRMQPIGTQIALSIDIPKSRKCKKRYI
jgi:hypothetical protein